MIRSLLLVLALASLARAQSHPGVYAVQGQDPTHGAYSGRAELRPAQGGGYAFVRLVEYASARHAGRRISLAWTGTARDVPAGVEVSLRLEKLGWLKSAIGVPITRTAADAPPVPVTATFAPQSGGVLRGDWSASGLALPQGETWTLQGPPGAAPIWQNERRRTRMHQPPSPLLKAILFGLFQSYHQTAWVQPYVARAELQAAEHFIDVDPTDFAVHRREPDLLRVIDRVPDALNLHEALLKSDAYGQTLARKAERADAEAPAFLDPSGALARRWNGQLQGEGDCGLWTGVYAYSQACRYQLTRDPAALANLERTLRCEVIQAVIDGDPASFARTLRTPSANQVPSSLWHAGTGAYAGIEWLEGGNNDMFKGLAISAVAAHEALPPGHALRGDLARALAELAAHSPLMQSNTSSNGLMAWGGAALLSGDPAHLAAYRRRARNPFRLLLGLFDGGFQFQSFSDWSGNQLGATGVLTRIRLAEHLREPIEGNVARLSLRMARQRISAVRPVLHGVMAAGQRSRVTWLPPADPGDAIQVLREVPFPRANVDEAGALRADFCSGPYPTAPWKLDWTTDQGRQHGVLGGPHWETGIDIYRWKGSPLRGPFGGAGTLEYASVDYLFAYWLARSEGVIGPND